MSFSDLLKGLFKDNKIVFSPKISLTINIGSGNNSGKSITYDQRKQLANIDVLKLSDVEKIKLQKLLKPELRIKTPLLDREYKASTKDYKEKIGQLENQELLRFFSDILPNEDFNILRAALYIRTIFKEHGDVTQLKSQLINRYGTKAANITNLCSANYFESWIKPLYEEMSKRPSFKKERFLEIYEEIIQYSPFALFVYRTMSDVEVIQHIMGKIERMKRYGIRTLNIHGIGHTNVSKIKNALEVIEKKIKFTKSILEEDSIIIIKLHFD